MHRPEDGLYAALTRRGMTRRAFLKFGAAMATALALPATYAPRITAAVERAARLPVIWLRGQGCGGATEAFLASAAPSVGELLLELLSVEYQDALMAPSGDAAVATRTGLAERYPNGYFAGVEGAIPTADDGLACAGGGRRRRGRRGPEGAPRQSPRLPGQCRERDRHDRPLPRLRRTTGHRRAPPAVLRLRRAGPQPVRAALPLRVRGIRPGLGRRGRPEGVVPLPAGLAG